VEEHVAFELIYECTRGHEADSVVVHDAEDIDDHVAIRNERCHELSAHDTCPAFVTLDRIAPFDTRKADDLQRRSSLVPSSDEDATDEELRPTSPEDTQETVKT
jgi:hypothetical protein